MSKIYTSLGLMSGTSLDGIDVALIKTDGEGFVEPGPSATFSYRPEQQAMLRQALQDALAINERTQRPGNLLEAEQQLTEWHIGAIEEFCKQFNITSFDIDVIGFHGQTVLHRPEQKLTVQLGIGQIIADRFSVSVVYDLRAADVAAGGQGAPLVPVYHRALAKNPPVTFVNIGGVANVTYVGEQGELLAFDTGPGNALINDWVQRYAGKSYDAGGAIAAAGAVSESHLQAAMAAPYFAERPPKSLDRNSFTHLNFDDLEFEAGAATLTAFTVQSIVKAADWFPTPVNNWIICGGGRHNTAIMSGLKRKLANVISAEEAGLNGDSMEAEAWAYLAVRSLRGLPISYPTTTGVGSAQSGGILASRSNK